MRVSGFRIYRYRLPLKRPIRTVNSELNHREGVLVELKDIDGNTAYGETAPLPGFSREDISRVIDELRTAKALVTSCDLPHDLEKLDEGFDMWFGGTLFSPSVRFGIESAVLELIARAKQQSLAALLGVKAQQAVRVNALLNGSTDDILSKAETIVTDGYRCVKLKVGHLSVARAVKLVTQVRDRIGDSVSLRLDANRAFVVDEALDLIDGIASFNIEYIEEPARNLNQLRKLLSEKSESVGVALDESLKEIRPEDLALGFSIKAIVIKPSMLGLEKAFRFARSAIDNDIVPVVSSSYESSVGMRVLTTLAALVAPDVPAGLDTIGEFADDLPVAPVRIINGQIAHECYLGTTAELRFDLLEEITGE